MYGLSPIKVNLEIQCHLKEAETKDITHVDILGNVFVIKIMQRGYCPFVMKSHEKKNAVHVYSVHLI